MANKAISELPQASNVNNQDLFVLEQSGIAKKLTAETFITEQGIIDALAEALDGHGGISSVTLSSVSGRIRTYLITFTDGSATTFQVYDGTSIDRIVKTSTAGLTDTYTVFMNDGTTTFFTVTNGADGTVSEAMLNDALKDKAPVVTETTESGAIANFTDGADDMVMHNVVAEINPEQDLSNGDPSPTNICPITGHTEVNVTRAGKNLCSSAIGRYAWVNGTRYVHTSTAYSATENIIPIAGGVTFVLTFLNTAQTTSVTFCWFKGETWLNNTVKYSPPYSATSPQDADGVAINFYNSSAYTGDPTVSNVQLEVGSSATDYEAYSGTTLTVDWTTEAGTVYGGTIDVATGLLTVDRVTVTVDGSQNFSDNGALSYGGHQVFFTPTPAKAYGILENYDGLMSDKFAIATAATALNLFIINGRKVNGNVYFNMPSDVTSAALAKTWFTNNPTQVSYLLATPQTYQLTPQEVKTLLGTNNVWADTGDTSVTYPADTKMFIEKLTMPTEDDLVANQAITSGKYFMIGNSLYLALANIANGAQITIGTNAQRVSLADALNAINS